MRSRRAGIAVASVLVAGRVWAAPTPPIEVRIEVTEVDHVQAARLGVEWPESLDFTEEEPAAALQVGRLTRSPGLRASVHLLVQEGAAELLANPNLITDSGTKATFHAGGQIPYTTTTSLGATNVEFKPYGVLMDVEPTLLETGQVRLRIKASVSAPDPANAVQVSGSAVPALLEREVTSNVTLESGATVTLAGLVQNQKDETVRGVPGLRRLPLLGALFRWKQSSRRRTTIVIFVTPRVTQL